MIRNKAWLPWMLAFGLAQSFLASRTTGAGLESAGNADGILAWRLDDLAPGQTACETVFFAFAPSHERLRDALNRARSQWTSRNEPPTGGSAPASGSPGIWITNGTTDFALAPDGSFLWEGWRQALNSPEGGQFSQFAYCVQYEGTHPGMAGAGTPSPRQRENLRIIHPVCATGKAEASGVLETEDRSIQITISAAMGTEALAIVDFKITNVGLAALSNLVLSVYGNLEAAPDPGNDFAVLDSETMGVLVVDASAHRYVSMSGRNRPATGCCGTYPSVPMLGKIAGEPFQQWKPFTGLSPEWTKRLAYASIPHPPAPALDPREPVTKTLPPAEADDALEQDWLEQAAGSDMRTRTRQEIQWTRQLVKRLEKKDARKQFLEELGQLASLEEKLEQSIKTPPAASQDKAQDKALYLDARRVKRKIAFGNPVIDFTQVMFIDQPYPQGSEWAHQARHRDGMMAAPGGRLLVLDGLHPGGKLRKLAPDKPGSFWRPDLSFDGKKVLYCYKPHDDKSFHLYEMNLDGTGRRQLTDGDYDDLDPIYLPDGHLLFSTTRANTYIRCMPYTYVYVLARCDADGKNTYFLSQNSETDWLPSLLPDGRVIYSRWEYTDKALWRIQSLWTVKPDGTGAATFWGNQSVWPDHLAEPRAIPGSARIMFTGLAHHNWFEGSIGIIDPRIGNNFPHGLTKITGDVAWPECGQPPSDTVEAPDYHTSGGATAYKTPYPLSEEDFLVSARGNGNFKLYLMDTHGNRELIHAGAHHIWHAIPVRSREHPPVLPDQVAWPGTGEKRQKSKPGYFYSADVLEGVPDLPREKVKYLRVLQMDARTYSTWTRDSRFSGPAVSLVQDDGVKRILGTIPIEPDGSVSFEAPPGVALHFQLLDEHHRALQTMRSFTGLMPGEQRGCTGCHESHSVSPQSRSPIAMRREPAILTPPPWGNESIGYERFVQPVLDRHCGKCHQGDGTARAKLDLTLRPGYLFYKEPYVTLVGYAQYSGLPASDKASLAGAIMSENYGQSDPDSYKTMRPMQSLSYRSGLIELAMSGKHYGVKVDQPDLLRLIAWVDANCPFRGEPEIRAIPDPDFAGIELLPVRPRTRTAPVIERP